jgi:hypothetical protein
MLHAFPPAVTLNMRDFFAVLATLAVKDSVSFGNFELDTQEGR